jgi:hypothetical protein
MDAFVRSGIAEAKAAAEWARARDVAMRVRSSWQVEFAGGALLDP